MHPQHAYYSLIKVWEWLEQFWIQKEQFLELFGCYRENCWNCSVDAPADCKVYQSTAQLMHQLTAHWMHQLTVEKAINLVCQLNVRCTNRLSKSQYICLFLPCLIFDSFSGSIRIPRGLWLLTVQDISLKARHAALGFVGFSYLQMTH